MAVDRGVQAAIDGELRLLEPAVRASRSALEELLEPGFREIGSSGAVWDRASIIAALTDEAASPPSAAPVVAGEIAGAVVAPGVVLLTFTTEGARGRAHRSSLWRLGDGGWRMCFHQGTPAA